jgi:hypothetical protein
MRDKAGRQICRGDLVEMSGSYFSANDGKYVVLRCDDVLRLQSLETTMRSEFSMPRVKTLDLISTEYTLNTLLVVGRCGRAAG